MSSITIRNLDPAIKERRPILQDALKGPSRAPASNLYQRIRALVEPLGGIDLEVPPREPGRDPPTFE